MVVESLLIKLKRMKYHLTEIGAKVILFEHIYGNGKNVLYGHIDTIPSIPPILYRIHIFYLFLEFL